MNILIGSTGFVGGHLKRNYDFDLQVHRSNVHLIEGCHADLLMCAGLPAAKWAANQNPVEDKFNSDLLLEVLKSVTASIVVLISTIDVYEPPIVVDERTEPTAPPTSAYGHNRLLFEKEFSKIFPNNHIIRLPALIAPDLRKNYVFDLLHKRAEFIEAIHPDSTFQFFDMKDIRELIDLTVRNNIHIINVNSPPITARRVAQVFGRERTLTDGNIVHYDVRSVHARLLDESEGPYLYSREHIIRSLETLQDSA